MIHKWWITIYNILTDPVYLRPASTEAVFFWDYCWSCQLYCVSRPHDTCLPILWSKLLLHKFCVDCQSVFLCHAKVEVLPTCRPRRGKRSKLPHQRLETHTHPIRHGGINLAVKRPQRKVSTNFFSFCIDCCGYKVHPIRHAQFSNKESQ